MPPTDTSDNFVYAPHALRLGGREWLFALGIVLGFVLIAPRLWTRAEPLENGGDYRVPYSLSDDYWLYQRHLQQAASEDGDAIFVVGDSVVWGEYVTRDGTLSHFLSDGGGRRFVNAGVNGLFPLALEGLINDYGRALRDRKVLLHANLLWMTSPEADLSTPKERAFNHEPLVPQLAVNLPCYRATSERRFGHLAGRKIEMLQWSKHLKISYFDQFGIPEWTLQPNKAYKNPAAEITREIPAEPLADPERGEDSDRHRPWHEGGRQPQSYDWVAPADSLQWGALQRLVRKLKRRGNDVLVVIGPLNEHMIADVSRPSFESWTAELRQWLEAEDIPAISPAPLASELYGDASHPLTGGYRALAIELRNDPEFERWLGR